MTEAVNPAADPTSDATLINAVRRGDAAAYGVLYERHLGAARRAAAGLVTARAEQEDLVAEAFTRVLRALRVSGGPTEAFRPYLLTTMRNAVISWSRRPAMLPFADIPDNVVATGGDDPVGTRFQASVAAEAFASLPERWRMVLWHTEIEGESPAEVAPLLGMTPNGVAALAYRARKGLRQAYLEQYLPTVERRGCRTVVEDLTRWVRHGLHARRMRQVTDHLDRCAGCRQIATGLKKISNELPTIVAPLVLGAPLAMAYLSAPAGTTLSSGAILTAATHAGTSTVSWVTTAKTILASAAIVTTTAVSTVASDPAPPPTASDHGTVVAAPADRRPPTAAAGGPDRARSTRPGSMLTPVPTTPLPLSGADHATPAAGEPQTQTQIANGQKKATKQAEKTAKHEAKQTAKDSQKLANANAEAKPVTSDKQKNKR